MDHKVPMRTYSRKGCKELAISLEKLHIPRINNVWNKSRISLKEDSSAPGIKKANNDSMYYDPFDTTFDRLVKNARYEICYYFFICIQNLIIFIS